MTIVVDKFVKDENDLFDIMDDWLWKDHFVFVGWYNLFLFLNTNFVTLRCVHELTNSYFESNLVCSHKNHLKILK